MALVAKMLGGIGKAVVGAGGTVLKSGAKFLGDDAVEALGRGVGKAQKGLDDIVQAAVKQDEIYKTAKNEARGIKKARKPSERATEAINQQRISEPITSYDYRQRIVNGKEVFEKRPTGAGDSAWASIDDVTEYRDARRNSHSNTAEFTYSSAETTGNLPAVIAQENCESGAGWWDGIPGWAKLGGAAVAGGIAGAFLADDD